jgi:hypothetical protein
MIVLITSSPVRVAENLFWYLEEQRAGCLQAVVEIFSASRSFVYS